MAYNNPENFLIAGNDEHGINPPTPGKRTPMMPYINRQIYENEFNYWAKNYFLADALRIGYYILDVKPNRQDLSISARVNLINRASPTLVYTFAYNAAGDGQSFSSANGVETFYSPINVFADDSKRLTTDVYDEVIAQTGANGRGVKTLDVSLLSAVRVPAGLIEAGFMTNFEEAKLMLDPDYQKLVGRSSLKGVSEYLNVNYTPIENENFTILRAGSEGRLVRYLQFMLKIDGFNINAVDGIFGPNTQNAVLAFQQANNLTSDGIVGPKTWASINLLNPERRVLRRGSIGSEVKYLQRKLYSKLYPVGTIDGIFGSNTERAVKDFQTENGLTPDGIVGPKTWDAIKDKKTSRPFPQN